MDKKTHMFNIAKPEESVAGVRLQKLETTETVIGGYNLESIGTFEEFEQDARIPVALTIKGTSEQIDGLWLPYGKLAEELYGVEKDAELLTDMTRLSPYDLTPLTPSLVGYEKDMKQITSSTTLPYKKPSRVADLSVPERLPITDITVEREGVCTIIDGIKYIVGDLELLDSDILSKLYIETRVRKNNTKVYYLWGTSKEPIKLIKAKKEWWGQAITKDPAEK